jgi:site-specific DNA recombinase
MRTVIYARKSTEGEDRQVHSLEDQLKVMREVARREGLTVVETFVESRSAKAPDCRPEFSRMLASVESGSAEAILTWAVNRLSRNPVDGGRLAYLLQTQKLRLIRTFDRAYTPEDSSLLLAIENAVATDYVRNLRKDVRRGMSEKAERGWHTSKAPLGYMNDPETRTILPDPERFEVLREAWKKLLAGESVAEIHRYLCAVGFTVRVRGGKSGGPVCRATLYGVFHSRTYVGEVPFKGRYLQANTFRW